MLPAAAMIELLMQGTQVGAVEKFEVLNPLVFDSQPDSSSNGGRKRWKRGNVFGTAEYVGETNRPSTRDCISGACKRLRSPSAAMNTTRNGIRSNMPDEAVATAEGRVYFGETMRVLREFAAAPGGALARGLAPADDPIPLLDACFVACGIYCQRKFKDAVLVEGVGRLVRDRAARAGEPLTIRLWHRGSAERIHSFDLVMTGSNGHVLIQAAGVRLITTGVAAHA